MRHYFFILILLLNACHQDKSIPAPKPFLTKHVFIVVMDGSRYSESWGGTNQDNIPNIRKLAGEGVMCTNFYNDGQTLTVSGHTAMTTGNYQIINNMGQDIPAMPSVFQYYLSQFSKPAEDAWIISSKDKLEVLSDCMDPDWAGAYRPRTDCGVNGNHTGYREDSVTYRHLIDTISKYHPHMVIVNFKEPDASGHANNWTDYIAGTQNVDKYVGGLWNFLQSDSVYAGTTTLFVTNDHGRHLNGVYDGFESHGCNCLGCRHVFLLAIGPDMKRDFPENQNYSLVDIPPTVCKLMGINMPGGQGKVMGSILNK